jgi:transcriptional regulator with XRE-family HTH domain
VAQPRSERHLAFGRALREVREQRGLSQDKLALECGLDRTYVSGVERGERNPSLGSIFKLVDELNVSLADLFRRMEELAR